MKKLVLILVAAVLTFSSCKFAQGLNERWGFKAPEDKNILTVFADFESHEYTLIDLGDDFVWDRTIITFDKLMENEAFSSWYKSLKNDSWDPVGLYVPGSNKGLLSGDKEFYVTKDEALVVGWNSPFEKVRVFANNFTDIFFEYLLPEIFPYDAVIELNYSELKQNPNFNKWQNDLGDKAYVSGREVPYSPVGFTEQTATATNYMDLVSTKKITLDKWKTFVKIGWRDIPLVNGATVWANRYDGDLDSYYIPFPEAVDHFNLRWSDLEKDSGFMKWYKNLTNPDDGKYTKGFTYRKEESYLCLYQYICYNSCYIDSYQKDLYVAYEWGQNSIYGMNVDVKEVPYLIPGESVQAYYSVSEECCSSVKSISFESSDTSVFSVDNHGFVTAVGDGSAYITFKITTYSDKLYTTESIPIYVYSDPEFKLISRFDEGCYDFDMSDDGRVQVFVPSDFYGQRIYVSTDYGRSWTYNSTDDIEIRNVSVSPSGQSIVVYGNLYGNYDNTGIYLSYDYCNSFRRVKSNVDVSPETLKVSDDGKTIVYAYYYYDNFGKYRYISIEVMTDSGKSRGSSKYSDIKYSELSSIFVSPSGKFVSYLINDTVYYSSDYGESFKELLLGSNNNESISDMKMSSDGQTILYLQSNRLYRYKMGNASSEEIIISVNSTNYYMGQLNASPDCTKILLSNRFASFENPYYSSDGGNTWRILETLNRDYYNSDFYVTDNPNEIFYFHKGYEKAGIYCRNRY